MTRQSQPNFTTVGPDGSVGAIFPGGLTIPRGTTETPPDTRRVAWTDGPGGAQVAYLYEWDDGTDEHLVISHLGATVLQHTRHNNGITPPYVSSYMGSGKLLIDAQNRSSFVNYGHPLSPAACIRMNLGGLLAIPAMAAGGSSTVLGVSIGLPQDSTDAGFGLLAGALRIAGAPIAPAGAQISWGWTNWQQVAMTVDFRFTNVSAAASIATSFAPIYFVSYFL